MASLVGGRSRQKKQPDREETMRIVSLVLTALIAIGGLAAGQLPGFAASSIRIKVDDQPITSYDIGQRTRLLQMTGVKGGEKAAIEELINETLQFIEAAKRGVTVSDKRVDAAVAEIAARVKMTPDGLAKALLGQGVDIDTLKRRIKAQMIWGQLVQARLRFEGASVKGSDITAAMFAEGAPSDIKTTEYMLQQIIFVVPGNASNGLAAQRQREAEAFRGRFGGCDGAVEQAKQLKGVVVRNLGRRTAEELAGSPEARDIQETPPGKVTRPLKTDQGYVLIAVCSTKTIQSNAAARVQTENRLLEEQNKDLGKDYLAELRKKALIEYR
jgi:peptidyl-prolyl cis-trans isomerase SurA